MAEAIDSTISLDLVINAGGESRRMGRPKALLPVPPGETPLVASVAARLACLLPAQQIVVANDATLAAEAGLSAQTRFVADSWPGTGTLGGIATGLQQVAGWALVVACDLPLVSPQVCALLLQRAAEGGWDAVVPRIGGYPEPLHALYHRRCLPAIVARLAQGERRVVSFMADVRTCFVEGEALRAVDPDLRSFFNANTPEEWQRALQLLAEETKL